MIWSASNYNACSNMYLNAVCLVKWQGLLIRSFGKTACPKDLRKYEPQEGASQSVSLHFRHMQHWHERLLQQQQKQQSKASLDLQAGLSQHTTEALLPSSSGSCQAQQTPPLPSPALQHAHQQQQLLHSTEGESALGDGMQLQQCTASGTAAATATTTATATTAAVSAVNTVSASRSPVAAGSDTASAVAAAAAEATQQIKLAAPGSASSTSSVDGVSPVCAEEECCAKVQTNCSEKTISSVQQQHTVKAVSAAAGSVKHYAAVNAAVLDGSVSGANSTSSSVPPGSGAVATASAPEAQQQEHQKLQGVTHVRIKYNGCDPNAPVLPIRLPVQREVLRLSRPALVATAAVILVLLEDFTADTGSDSNDSDDDGYKPASAALTEPARVSVRSSARATAAAAAAAATAAAAAGGGSGGASGPTVNADGATGTIAKAKPATTAAAVDTAVLSASASEQRTAQLAQLAAASDSSVESDTDETPLLSTHAGGSSSGAAAAAAAAPVDTSFAVAAAAATISSSNCSSAVQLDDEEYDASVQAQLTQLRSSTANRFYAGKDRAAFADDALKDWVVNRHGALREKLAKLQLWCQQGHMSSSYRAELAQLTWLVALEQRAISDRKAIADIMIGLARSPPAPQMLQADTDAAAGATGGVAANGTATGVPLHNLDSALLDDLRELKNLTAEGHWSQECRVEQSYAAVRQYTAVRLASTEAELLTKVATLLKCGTDGLIDQQDIKEHIRKASLMHDAHTAWDAATIAAAVAAADAAADAAAVTAAAEATAVTAAAAATAAATAAAADAEASQ
eukprot:4497-Heterococcus_DN1.PRE.2